MWAVVISLVMKFVEQDVQVVAQILAMELVNQSVRLIVQVTANTVVKMGVQVPVPEIVLLPVTAVVLPSAP